MRAFAFALAMGALVGCTVETAQDLPPASASEANVFLPTERLVAKSSVRADVDRLAAGTAVTSERTGASEITSREWILYQRIVKATSPAEQLALLSHKSPIVRGFFLRHVIAEIDSSFERVYPLLADPTPLLRMSGCTGGGTTIADMAFEGLAPMSEAFFLRVASDPRVTVGVRARAVEALARERHPEARRLVLEALASSDPELHSVGIRALGAVAEDGDIDQLAGFARSSAPALRQETARALRDIETPRACELLLSLFADPDAGVQSVARRAYAENRASDPVKLRAFLQADRTTAEDILFGLERRESEAAFDIAEVVLMTDKPLPYGTAGTLVHGLVKTAGPRAIPRLRKVLDSPHQSARESALFFLADLADAASIPRMRVLLRHAKNSELEAAAHALVKLRAKEAIPDLQAAVAREDGGFKESIAKDLEALKKIAGRAGP